MDNEQETLGKGLRPARRSRRRFRPGCTNCRLKRIKCDEQRPECGGCMRSLQPCPGYPARDLATSYPVLRSSNKRQSSDETVQPDSQPPKEDGSNVPPMRECEPESSLGGNAVKSEGKQSTGESEELGSKEIETDLPLFVPCSFPSCGEMTHSWLVDEKSRRFCGGHRCTVTDCPQQICAESRSRHCKTHAEQYNESGNYKVPKQEMNQSANNHMMSNTQQLRLDKEYYAEKRELQRILDEFGSVLDESLIIAIARDYDVVKDFQEIRDVLKQLAKAASAEPATGFDPSGLGHNVPELELWGRYQGGRRTVRLKKKKETLDRKEASFFERGKRYEALRVQDKEPKMNANAEGSEFTSAFANEKMSSHGGNNDEEPGDIGYAESDPSPDDSSVHWGLSDEDERRRRKERRRMRRRSWPHVGIRTRSQSSEDDVPTQQTVLDFPPSADGDEVFVSEEISRELPYYDDDIFGPGSPSDTKANSVLFSDDHPRFNNPSMDDSQGHISSYSDKDSNDLYMSDLESILSEAPSLASSQSSTPLDVNTGAVDELRSLLLLNDTLKPLYEEGIHKVGAERFQRNFRRLLVRYGRDLGSEASTPLQVQAARFIRFAALRVSVQIKNILVNKHEQADRDRVQEARTKVLAYLKQMEDEGADSSDEDESIYDPEEAGLRSLESVKNFMVSSTAFSHLCVALRKWLNLEGEDEKQPPAQASRGEKPEEPSHIPVDVPTVIPVQKATRVCDENTGATVVSDDVDKANHCVENLPLKQSPYIGTCKTNSPWTSAMRRRWQHCIDIASDLFQGRVPKGQVRVSWTCRCGDRLRMQVPDSQHQAAVTFAQEAAGPNATTVVSQTSSISRQSSDSSSSTSAANTTGPSTSRPQSPNTIPSDPDTDTSDPPDPFIPAGTKQYMLLVVNTHTLHTLRPLRKLVNVDVTDVTCGGELFKRLQTAYNDLRSTKRINHNPFIVPKTMHYVKLQLLHLQKSGPVVGPYEVDSIPSRKEIQRREYAFSPCPPQIGPLPMPPDIFMHSFLDPTDHLGPIAVSMLPKKLDHQLSVSHTMMNTTGWGFYIIEGISWALVSWLVVLTIALITVLTIVWSKCTNDIQAGTGIGQYCLAVVALSVSVYLIRDKAS